MKLVFASKSEKIELKYRVWRRWFAWRPVRMPGAFEREYRWFEFVAVRINPHRISAKPIFEYMPLDQVRLGSEEG